MTRVRFVGGPLDGLLKGVPAAADGMSYTMLPVGAKRCPSRDRLAYYDLTADPDGLADLVGVVRAP